MRIILFIGVFLILGAGLEVFKRDWKQDNKGRHVERWLGENFDR